MLVGLSFSFAAIRLDGTADRKPEPRVARNDTEGYF